MRADLHAVSERDDGTDLIVEVKAWEREVTRDAVRFIEVKEMLEEPATMLAEAGILILDPEKLASYETPPDLDPAQRLRRGAGAAPSARRFAPSAGSGDLETTGSRSESRSSKREPTAGGRSPKRSSNGSAPR